MSIKYSILMPYHKRAKQLLSTLKSFIHYYQDRNDFEVIIAEDIKNYYDDEEHNALFETIKYAFPFLKIRVVISGDVNSWNPTPQYNIAAAISRGEYLIITNPECMHKVNVLAGLDAEIEKNPEAYVLCGCLSVAQVGLSVEAAETVEGGWYQHSIHRNAMLHFCSCIRRIDFEQIGGFDPNYSRGVCFEDDDFRNRIMQANIPFVLRDDLVVIHLAHKKSKSPDYLRLHTINRLYYESQWGRDSLKAEVMSVENIQEI